MPHQVGVEMPDDRQPFVIIKVVKSSAMNKPEGVGPYLKVNLT